MTGRFACQAVFDPFCWQEPPMQRLCLLPCQAAVPLTHKVDGGEAQRGARQDGQPMHMLM